MFKKKEKSNANVRELNKKAQKKKIAPAAKLTALSGRQAHEQTPGRRRRHGKIAPKAPANNIACWRSRLTS